jgi:hypothetical protein
MNECMYSRCMQVLGLAVPLLVIVQNEPMSAMFLSSAVIFLNDLCTMTLIFIPKINAMVRNYALHMMSNDGVTHSPSRHQHQQHPKRGTGGTGRNLLGGWRGKAAQVNPESSSIVSSTSNVNSAVVNTES